MWLSFVLILLPIWILHKQDIFFIKSGVFIPRVITQVTSGYSFTVDLNRVGALPRDQKWTGVPLYSAAPKGGIATYVFYLFI